MANEEVERLHVYAPAYDLRYFTGLDPHEIIVVSLEDELFTPKKVIIALDSVIASKAFLLDS
jgi:hypothetical protein